MDHKPIILKQELNKQEFNNQENILITKYKDLVINFEIPPADHSTKKFILNPVKGSRYAPTRIPNQHQLVWVEMRKKSFKVLPIYSNKWCTALHINSYNTSFCSKNTWLNPKSLHSEFVVKAHVLLTMICPSNGEIKSGNLFNAFC